MPHITQIELPPAFLARMERLLGDEYDAFLTSYDTPPSVGLRVNTLKLSPERFGTLSSFDLTPIPWSPAAFTVPTTQQPGRHPYHAAGLYYLQDPSAMVAAELLAPQPGERVLDLAAAPGGKATHIASLMGNRGLLVANEIHPQRVWDLAENLERWGARNAVITNETPERLADRFGGFFDRVLVDAPCSGEGMFRKSPTARQEWTPDLVRGCALRQSAILTQAARLVRPGGRLVYSTCTFAPEENEGVVARFLQEQPAFELIEPARQPGYAAGHPDWLAERTAAPVLRRSVRLWPHTGPGEGHFVAVLRHIAGGFGDEPKPWPRKSVPQSALRLYHAFCRAHLTRIPAEKHLALVGSYLYALPSNTPDLAGLRFIHSGWWLGTIKKSRFEPSQALAMGIEAKDARRVLDLAAGEAAVLAYLRGETLRSEGDNGWVLVMVAGFPLGWGKRVGNRVKSRYPRGLRWH